MRTAKTHRALRPEDLNLAPITCQSNAVVPAHFKQSPVVYSDHSQVTASCQFAKDEMPSKYKKRNANTDKICHYTNSE